MSIISEALVFATAHHGEQFRKGTRIPYMTHLLNVCRILAEHDCEDEILASGLLHDVLEDTPVTYKEVESRFGKRIAHIVEGCTEELKKEGGDIDPVSTWKTRKVATLEYIRNSTEEDILLVTAADKLDNLRSLVNDHAHVGEELWGRFNASRDEIAWYYESVAEALLEHSESSLALKSLASEMLAINNELFHEPVF